jgi:hypothetical protein
MRLDGSALPARGPDGRRAWRTTTGQPMTGRRVPQPWTMLLGRRALLQPVRTVLLRREPKRPTG